MIAKIDADKEASLCVEWNVEKLPTLLLFLRGTCVETIRGASSSKLLETIEALIPRAREMARVQSSGGRSDAAVAAAVADEDQAEH